MKAPKNIPRVFGIEGLDRIGKSCLIQGILDTLGYYQVIHFAKPQRLRIYDSASKVDNVVVETQSLWYYQRESFLNSMLLAKSAGRIIFDRWHIGEAVYAPLYRNYDGNYVFSLERNTGLDELPDVRLILLIEDEKISKHFQDDGKSLGPPENRAREQKAFIEAFNSSRIRDKRFICVTGKDGNFRSKEEILNEAL